MSATNLAAGWNITSAFVGAPGERSNKILALIATLQSKLNTDWRAASKQKSDEKLAAAQKAIEESEKAIQAAVQPEPLHFEIEKEAR